jgi:ribokinase
VLVATARELPALARAGVRLDALVHSGHDAGERYVTGALDPEPELVVTTAGPDGGAYRYPDGGGGTYASVALDRPSSDSYGAGDCFAAGLTYGLGRGDDAPAALALAAACGAAALAGPGVHVERPLG